MKSKPITQSEWSERAQIAGSAVLEEGIDLTQPITVRDMERKLILATISRTGGNLTEAMRQLGLGRTTLYRKLVRYGLKPQVTQRTTDG